MTSYAKEQGRRFRAYLLSRTRRQWILWTIACFSGWQLFLIYAGINFSLWLAPLDAFLNFGWVIGAAGAFGMIEALFEKPVYTVSPRERRGFLQSLASFLSALVAFIISLAVIVITGAALGSLVIRWLGPFSGWMVNAGLLLLLLAYFVRRLRRDRQLRREAIERWQAEQGASA